MGDAPAGWHPDPNDAGQQRYWDGQQWTEHTAPAAVPTPTPVPPPRTAPPPPAQAPFAAPSAPKKGSNKTVLIVVAACVAVLVVGLIAVNAGSSDKKTTSNGAAGAGASSGSGDATFCTDFHTNEQVISDDVDAVQATDDSEYGGAGGSPQAIDDLGEAVDRLSGEAPTSELSAVLQDFQDAIKEVKDGTSGTTVLTSKWATMQTEVTLHCE